MRSSEYVRAASLEIHRSMNIRPAVTKTTIQAANITLNWSTGGTKPRAKTPSAAGG
jgi:hypothetical protein